MLLGNMGAFFERNKNGPDPLHGFVSDGAVFAYDAIDRGDEAGKWKDLIGGASWTLTAKGAFDDTSFVCSGGSYAAGLGGYIPMYKSVFVAWKSTQTSGTPVLMFGIKTNVPGSSQASRTIVLYSNGVMFSGMSGITRNSLPCNALSGSSHTASAQLSSMDNTINSEVVGGMIDGLQTSPSYVSDTWGFTTTESQLGARGASYAYTGRIYCIIGYNRDLSEIEMLKNHTNAVSRFNLA